MDSSIRTLTRFCLCLRFTLPSVPEKYHWTGWGGWGEGVGGKGGGGGGGVNEEREICQSVWGLVFRKQAGHVDFKYIPGCPNL